MKHITKLTVGLITIALVSCNKSESQISTDVSTQNSRSNPIITARQDNTPLNQIALNRLAENMTVEVVARSVVSGGDPFGSSGSGVIIGKEGSTYYVLSANHIFLYPNDYRVVVRSKKPGEDAEILKLEIIYRYPDADLAVFKFASVKQYKVAEIGEASQLRKNSQVYVGGWPGVENREGFQFTPAKVTNPQAGDFLTYEPTVSGEGVYPGMSGGAVLNEAGQLMGIHVGVTKKVDGDGKGVLVSTFLRDMPQQVSRVVVRSTRVALPSPTPSPIRKNPTVTNRNTDNVTPSQTQNRVLVRPTPVFPPRNTRRTSDNTRIPETTSYLPKVILQQEGTLSDGDLILPSDESIYDEHTFEGTNGQVVNVTLKSPDFDTYLAVFSPTDELLGEHDDVNKKNTNSELTITLPVTGRYRVIVNSYDKNGRGEYNLQIIQVKNPTVTNTNTDNITASQIQEAESFLNLGYEHYEREEFEQAIADLNKAIRLNPKLVKAYYVRGIVYRKQGKYDLAIADLNQAIRLNPKLVKAYNVRGIVYYDQGKYDLAIADYNQAIQLNPKYAAAYNNRGLTYKAKRNIEKAISDFEKAADLYKQQGNQTWYQNALDQLKKLRGS